MEPSKNHPPRGRVLKSIICVFVLVAAAVVLGRPQSSGPLTDPRPAGQREAMGDFVLPTLAGRNWRLSEHQGHVVLLNFWATWCPPCREETPGLVRVAAANKAQGLDMAGVSMDNSDVSKVRGFVSEYAVPYPILLPAPLSPLTYAVQAYPTTYLIDRQGRVAATYVGALDEDQLQRQVTRLLAEKP